MPALRTLIVVLLISIFALSCSSGCRGSIRVPVGVELRDLDAKLRNAHAAAQDRNGRASPYIRLAEENRGRAVDAAARGDERALTLLEKAASDVDLALTLLELETAEARAHDAARRADEGAIPR